MTVIMCNLELKTLLVKDGMKDRQELIYQLREFEKCSISSNCVQHHGIYFW